MQEIDKQSIVLKKGIEKYTNFTELQDSSNATKERLHEIMEKYSRAIQLVGVVGNASQRNMDKVDGRSEWNEIQDLTAKINLLEQDLLLHYTQAQLSESMASYGELKANCLRLVDSINQCNKKNPRLIMS